MTETDQHQTQIRNKVVIEADEDFGFIIINDRLYIVDNEDEYRYVYYIKGVTVREVVM